MNIRQVQESIDEGHSLKLIAQSYSEIASIKLKRIRSDVESTRQFFQELTQVYALIKKIAALRKITPPKKSKNLVSILLTSNYRFHGSINNKLIQYFMINTSKIPCDKIIIGKTGQEYLKSIHYFHTYDSVTFNKDLPTPEELQKLSIKIQDYEQVLVYYAQFKTVLVQTPTLKDITQTQNPLPSLKEEKIATDFIFEPDILKMLMFFDNQIKLLLLEQTLFESELARTASRLISMDQAQNNANDFIKENNMLLSLTKRSVNNIRLLETVNSHKKHRKSRL